MGNALHGAAADLASGLPRRPRLTDPYTLDVNCNAKDYQVCTVWGGVCVCVGGGGEYTLGGGGGGGE